MNVLIKKIVDSSDWYHVYLEVPNKSIYVGHCKRLEDGVYHYWPNDIDFKGYWSSENLKAVATKLDELNNLLPVK